MPSATMTSATKPARSRRSEREVPIPFREVKHLVVERFPVPMAIHGTNSKGGGRQFYPNIEGLRLNDGTERFLCTSVKGCQHTYTSYGKVRYHIGQEHPNPKKVAKRARQAATAAADPAAQPVLPEPEPEPAPKPAAAAAPEPVVVPPPNTPLTEPGLDQMVRTFTALAESRNEWRERAETAEKQVIVEKEARERAEKDLGEMRERLRKLIGG